MLVHFHHFDSIPTISFFWGLRNCFVYSDLTRPPLHQNKDLTRTLLGILPGPYSDLTRPDLRQIGDLTRTLLGQIVDGL